MALSFTQRFFLSPSLLLLLLLIALSSSSLTGCPVNFEFLNYTIITCKCKGAQVVACPYANVLNDLTNDCATIMFSFINLYGKYPPGFFASMCHEGKKGITINCLPAAAASPPSVSADDTGMKTHQMRVSVTVVVVVYFHVVMLHVIRFVQ
uniref:GPI-anchored protein LLG1-like domain-containing protein n=1 Tax=Glycine max TaxID=3847 RepID=A0A0R0K768_SOYBN